MSIRYIIAFFSLAFLFFCKKEHSKKEFQHPIEVQDNWYETTFLAPNTYIIEEPQSSQGNVSYLFFGENEALMFDTGSGENTPVNGTKIQYLLEQLTDKPITLLLSHFHFDHSQNIAI